MALKGKTPVTVLPTEHSYNSNLQQQSHTVFVLICTTDLLALEKNSFGSGGVYEMN